MKTYNHNTPADYFKSIEVYGIMKPVKGTDYHDLKFSCTAESAGKIIREFRATLPELKDRLIYHVFFVNTESKRVIFGGRFHNNSRVKNFLYDLIAKHK